MHLIVQQTALRRRLAQDHRITEITGMEGDVITMQDIFKFKQEGFDAEGRVRGPLRRHRLGAEFYDELQPRGIPVNMDIFREDA